MVKVNRDRVQAATSGRAGTVAGSELQVSSYNVLSARKVQVRRGDYSHCVPHVLNFAVRKSLLLDEISKVDSDICCLQSVDHFDDWWQPQLSVIGYDGVFNARTGGVPGEGVAIFFKRHLFQLFKTTVIDFNDMSLAGLSEAEKSRRTKYKGQRAPPNNVGLIIGLQPWEKSKHPSAVVVANVELDDNLNSGQLKRNNQCIYLFRQIEQFNSELHLPIILGGTFNCEPGKCYCASAEGRGNGCGFIVIGFSFLFFVCFVLKQEIRLIKSLQPVAFRMRNSFQHHLTLPEPQAQASHPFWFAGNPQRKKVITQSLDTGLFVGLVAVTKWVSGTISLSITTPSRSVLLASSNGENRW